MNKLAYLSAIKNTCDSLPQDRREPFDLQRTREKPHCRACLEPRHRHLRRRPLYIGGIALGVVKLITFGGFGIRAFIGWFLIMGAARKKNIEIAGEVRAMLA